jgi:diguanylate cyclase (GGDEF)-like protein
VSIGVATLTDGNGDSKRLVAQADEALYRAKRQGKNRAAVWSETA